MPSDKTSNTDLQCLLQRLQYIFAAAAATNGKAFTCDEILAMTHDLMKRQPEEVQQKCADTVLCEQELRNPDGISYTPSRRVDRSNQNGTEKLFSTELQFISTTMIKMYEKYPNHKDLSFEIIYLGAASGVTIQTTKSEDAQFKKGHRVLNHVERLEIMFPKPLINRWWYIDPRQMVFSRPNDARRHLQRLFSDKEIRFFNSRQQSDPNIRYIVISDIRTPINYHMCNAPRDVAPDIVRAYFMCTGNEAQHRRKASILMLLKNLMRDAIAKTELEEKIIAQDQQYQKNVRNSLNLDAMSSKFRAPYFYPHTNMAAEQEFIDVPRVVQPYGPVNSTELREWYILRNPVEIQPLTLSSQDNVELPDIAEVDNGNEDLNWRCAPTADTNTAYTRFDLKDFDNKLAAYNHVKNINENKLRIYTKAMYEYCLMQCMKWVPTKDQSKYLDIQQQWHAQRHQLLDGKADIVFHAYLAANSQSDEFFASEPCLDIQRLLTHERLHHRTPSQDDTASETDDHQLSQNDTASHRSNDEDHHGKYEYNEDSFQAQMGSVLSAILVRDNTSPESNKSEITFQALMDIYANAVSALTKCAANYSNMGCNPKCPLFIQRVDILMHLRLLILISFNPKIVTDWLNLDVIRTNKDKYIPLIQRLLSVYDRTNYTRGMIGNFSYESAEAIFKKTAINTLSDTGTLQTLEYMLGYVHAQKEFPLGFDLHTRHWAIVFYNSCIMKIVDVKFDFKYPMLPENIMRDKQILLSLRQFCAPYLQMGDDGCQCFGSNPAWNTAIWPAGYPVLHYAARYGCTALVYLILTEFLPQQESYKSVFEKYINFQRRRNGYTALHLAVYGKHRDVENLLLHYGARDDIPCREQDNRGHWLSETTQDLRTKIRGNYRY